MPGIKKNVIIINSTAEAQTSSFSRVYHLRPHYCSIKKPFWNVWYVDLSYALELWANVIKVSRSWNDNLWELKFQIKFLQLTVWWYETQQTILKGLKALIFARQILCGQGINLQLNNEISYMSDQFTKRSFLWFSLKTRSIFMKNISNFCLDFDFYWLTLFSHFFL